jgi:hypothetical protein
LHRKCPLMTQSGHPSSQTARVPLSGCRSDPLRCHTLVTGNTMTAYLKFTCRSAFGLLACLSLASISNTSAQAQDRIFQFGLIGDMPYTTVQQQEFQRVIAALNKADLAFVVHIGDFQNDPRGYSRPSACCPASMTTTKQYTSHSRASGIRSF